MRKFFFIEIDCDGYPVSKTYNCMLFIDNENDIFVCEKSIQNKLILKHYSTYIFGHNC